MFNHVGFLTLTSDVTDTQIEAVLAGLLALPGQIDGLLGAEVVRDAGVSEGNASLKFHMRFDSEDAWRAYGDHPAHVALAGDHIVPVLSGASFVQYDDAGLRVATA